LKAAVNKKDKGEMVHPLVEQLRFTRAEWLRGLEDVTAEEAARCFEPMNSIAWMVGHLACQEQRYWLQQAQNRTLAPEVMACGSGQPPCNPPLREMWTAWHKIVDEANLYLDKLTSETLLSHVIVDNQPQVESLGTKMRRTTYHYWFHLGEASAIRQLLGHTELPQFVGDISRVPYRPE
jgi:hypothetical protein